MTDFVHLDDMLVMFRPACCAHCPPPFLSIKTMARECSGTAGVQVSGLRCRIAPWGDTHEQVCDQAFGAGNVLDGAGRGAPAPPGPCRDGRSSVSAASRLPASA